MSAPPCFSPTPAAIAAIPDLIEACKYAQSWIEALRDPDADPGMVSRGEGRVWSALNAAVRKAEGRNDRAAKEDESCGAYVERMSTIARVGLDDIRRVAK